MSTLISGLQPITQRLTSNFFTNATGVTGPALLSAPISGANFSFQANLYVGGATAGVRLGASVPSGAIFASSIEGVSTGINDQMVSLITPTCASSQFCQNSATGAIIFNGLVLAPAGVTGTMQILIASMQTTGVTGGIYTGSSITILSST